MDLVALAVKLTAADNKIRKKTTLAVRKAAVLLESTAKNAIGTYEFGWPSLAESTLARKAADTPLLEKGDFRDSIGIRIDGDSAMVFSDDEKAIWFEEGTSKMPPRPVFGPSVERCSDEMEKVFVSIPEGCF